MLEVLKRMRSIFVTISQVLGAKGRTCRSCYDFLTDDAQFAIRLGEHADIPDGFFNLADLSFGMKGKHQY